MAISTANLTIRSQGAEGRKRHLPVDGGAHIRKGTLVSQLTATGMVVPLTTASSGGAVGVAQHEADNSDGADGDLRCVVESGRIYEFANDGTNPFSDASLVGSLAYATDDHTVSDTQAAAEPIAGYFVGLEESGRVAIFVDPALIAAAAYADANDAIA